MSANRPNQYCFQLMGMFANNSIYSYNLEEKEHVSLNLMKQYHNCTSFLYVPFNYVLEKINASKDFFQICIDMDVKKKCPNELIIWKHHTSNDNLITYETIPPPVFGIHLLSTIVENDLYLRVKYNKYQYDDGDMIRLLTRWKLIYEYIATQDSLDSLITQSFYLPDEVNLYKQIKVPIVSVYPTCVHHFFINFALSYPNKIAIYENQYQYTYIEVLDMSRKLAHF